MHDSVDVILATLPNKPPVMEALEITEFSEDVFIAVVLTDNRPNKLGTLDAPRTLLPDITVAEIAGVDVAAAVIAAVVGIANAAAVTAVVAGIGNAAAVTAVVAGIGNAAAVTAVVAVSDDVGAVAGVDRVNDAAAEDNLGVPRDDSML